MKFLKIGISGVRGIVGDTLTPELTMDFASAFGTYINSRKVLIGRDTRNSGPMLHAATTSALLAAGCNVVDLGICPTPILQYMVKRLKARGAISISAGHNDADWNALTFINQEGTYLNSYQGEEVLDIYHLEKFKKVSTDKLGRVDYRPDELDNYFDKLTKFLNAGAIKDAGFKVVIDACNGGGAGIIDIFCKHLDCELIPVNNERTGFFPHDPEPRPRNASEVASITKIVQADAGFLLNSDVSRISIVAEDGETLSEEYTLPLIAGYFLRKQPGAVITNYSTSRMIEDVSQCLGCQVIKAKVGQSDCIQKMIEEDGVMAGEGSGSVAIKEFQPAFDGFLAMGMILEMMAVKSKKISEMVKELPKYHIMKEKIYCPPVKAHSIVNEIRKLYASQEISTKDGIKVEWKDGWVHIRASATEPMIRVISESQSKEKAQERFDKAANFISQQV
jgi:phosphomannomutase